jgi:hypothetical protein
MEKNKNIEHADQRNISICYSVENTTCKPFVISVFHKNTFGVCLVFFTNTRTPSPCHCSHEDEGGRFLQNVGSF